MLRLLAEVLVNTQRILRIDFRHFEIMFENVDDSLVACLEEDKKILDQHPESRDVELILKIVEVELREDQEVKR